MQGRFPDFYFLCSPHTIEVSGFTSHLFKATLENKETSNVSAFIHLSTAKRIAPFLKNEMRIFKEKRNAATM